MDILYIRIKQRREELGLSQEELAYRLGYKSRSSINKIEMGENDIPQSKIKEFAKALATTPNYLMGLDNNSPNINLDGLSDESIQEIQRFAEFVRSKEEAKKGDTTKYGT